MKVNTVLIWIAYISSGLLLGLILMILHGNIGFDTEWIQPATIATLIGGLGGALAGTWLSGRNANKQWEKQKENEKLEIEQMFNEIVYSELILLETKLPNIFDVSFLHSRNIKNINIDELSENEILYDFVISKSVAEFKLEFDKFFERLHQLVTSRIIDLETYVILLRLKEIVEVAEGFGYPSKPYSKKEIEALEAGNYHGAFEMYIHNTNIVGFHKYVFKLHDLYDETKTFLELKLNK